MSNLIYSNKNKHLIEEKFSFNLVSAKDAENNIKNISNIKNVRGVTPIHIFKKSRLPKIDSLGLPLLAYKH